MVEHSHMLSVFFPIPSFARKLYLFLKSWDASDELVPFLCFPGMLSVEFQTPRQHVKLLMLEAHNCLSLYLFKPEHGHNARPWYLVNGCLPTEFILALSEIIAWKTLNVSLRVNPPNYWVWFYVLYYKSTVVILAISAIFQPGLAYFTDLFSGIDPLWYHILPRPLDWVLQGSLLWLRVKEQCFSGEHGLLVYGSALALRSSI